MLSIPLPSVQSVPLVPFVQSVQSVQLVPSVQSSPVTPCIPCIHWIPCTQLSPLGITKSKIAALVVPELLTAASVPALPVVVLPTSTVAASHWTPFKSALVAF